MMTAGREPVVVDDVAAAAAECIAEAVRAGGNIALSGGSTPRKAHERLAEMDLDWSQTVLWFGDDRAVGPDHEHSNYRMARESLLDRIEGPQPEVHRIEGELGYQRAAVAYEQTLRERFGAGVPELDLLLLGLGSDGHTASLFPHDGALDERERLAVGVETPGMAPLVSRVTLTLPVLDAAQKVLFLISGADKADAVRRAFGSAPSPDAPAGLVDPAEGELVLLMDPPAAAGMGDRA